MKTLIILAVPLAALAIFTVWFLVDCYRNAQDYNDEHDLP